nr:hypothetical protein [Tanacetum cinerariifolium]
ASLKRMIIDKYCPRGEIQKLESKYWNLKVKGIDLLNYNHRFQELALMCDRMFLEESAKVERCIYGLLDMIHGSVKASKPQSMQEAIKFATEIMDKKMLTHAERQEIRSLMEEPNLYVPSKIITMMGPVHQSAPTGHYKCDFLKLKNGNQWNQAGNENVVARAYAVGTARTNPNLNVVMGERKLKKDKIRSKPDKNEKRGEAGKSLKQLQWIEEEKRNKTQKEGPETQTQSKSIQVLKNKRKEKGLKCNSMKVLSGGPFLPKDNSCTTKDHS